MATLHHQRNIQETGFTLVETLVSVLMISVVLVAITSLLTRSLGAIASSQDFFVASKIALEGMEMMRTKRNNNLIASAPGGIVWNSNMPNGMYELDGITAATPVTGPLVPGKNLTAAPASPSTFCVSTASATAGRYTYTCGADTRSLQGNFTRTITVSNTSAHYAQVTVTVTWDSPRSPYVLSTILYNAS
jgi:type II secretory pathway pseudopilin PulG